MTATDAHGKARLLLLFDGRCGFCTACVEWALARDRAGRIQALPNQTPGILQGTGLTRTQVERQVWVVDRRGRAFGGAAAVVRVLQALGGTWAALAALYRLPGAPWLAERGYTAVSRIRGRLSFLGVTPTCDRPGADCTE